MTSDVPNAALDPAFFNGRFMVEPREWNWNIYLALSHPEVPVEFRFQGGLSFSRAIEIIGRVRAPDPHKGKRARIWLSPFGPEVTFGGDGLDMVGQFYKDRPGADETDFEARLYLPEAALPPAVTCLGSVWRYLDIWIGKYEGYEAAVTAFSFSDSIHPNIAEWAGPPLEDGRN
jgi:hypothetical protein